MVTAHLTLASKGDLQPATRAGFCFRPVSSSYFADAEREMRDLLHASSWTTATQVTSTDDSYGFRWIVLEDRDFEDLVATMHLAAQALEEKGFGEQILAAVFRFEERGRPVYWIFNYRRGRYYPFVPRGMGQERDHSLELHLRSLMEKELPLEPEITYWYPLWGVPV